MLIPFIRIANAAGRSSGFLFADTLPAFKEELKSVDDLNFYGAKFAEIARASKEPAGLLLSYGLPAVKGLIVQYGFRRKYDLISALRRFRDSMPGPFTETDSGLGIQNGFDEQDRGENNNDTSRLRICRDQRVDYGTSDD